MARWALTRRLAKLWMRAFPRFVSSMPGRLEVPLAEFPGEDPEDDVLVSEMAERGRAYLSSFEWCGEIIETYVGDMP